MSLKSRKQKSRAYKFHQDQWRVSPFGEPLVEQVPPPRPFGTRYVRGSSRRLHAQRSAILGLYLRGLPWFAERDREVWKSVH